MNKATARLYTFRTTPDLNVFGHLCHDVYSKIVRGRWGSFMEFPPSGMNTVCALAVLKDFRWAPSISQLENSLGCTQVPMKLFISTDKDVSFLNTKFIKFIYDEDFPTTNVRSEIDEWVLRKHNSTYLNAFLEKKNTY